MKNQLTITINGKTEAITSPLSVSQLLELKNLDAACVVVELNKNIIAKESFPQTVLAGGDTLEILRFVGGG